MFGEVPLHTATKVQAHLQIVIQVLRPVEQQVVGLIGGINRVGGGRKLNAIHTNRQVRLNLGAARAQIPNRVKTPGPIARTE